MLTYYNCDSSPNCFKTKILLNELGIDYEQRDFQMSELSGPEFSAKFPNSKVPAIEDDGQVIAESGAIALYLTERHGGPVPKDSKARALMHQAMNFESALLAPVIGGTGIFGELGRPEGERDMARVEKLMPEAQRVAHVLGTVLGDRDYFAGDFSIADIQLYAGTTKAIQYQVFKNPPQNLVDWNARMGARPTVKDAAQHYDGYRD